MTGVQTCALPIYTSERTRKLSPRVVRRSSPASSRPAQVLGLWNDPNGKGIFALWGGKLSLWDPVRLDFKAVIADTLGLVEARVMGEGIFLSDGPRGHSSSLLDPATGKKTRLQPASFLSPYLPIPEQPQDAILFGHGKYLASRF